jgi:hypothetical protein
MKIVFVPGAQLSRHKGVRPQSEQMESAVGKEIKELLRDNIIEP